MQFWTKKTGVVDKSNERAENSSVIGDYLPAEAKHLATNKPRHGLKRTRTTVSAIAQLTLMALFS
jgi:hypothetical protein